MEMISLLMFIVFAPFVGGLLSWADRKITARMQGRVGPPVWQPFYDVFKLFQKENLVVRRSQDFYIWFYLGMVVFTGALFFIGENILLVIFALTLAETFFVLGAYKSSSPYSFVGTQRELVQIISYEPVLIFSAVGMYMVTGSFYVNAIAMFDQQIVRYLPGLLFSFLYVLAIKFRKSPFDLSTSHHAHQELVKGVTTEFTGKTLAMIEVAHWYENVIILGFLYLFFGHNPVLGVAAAGGAYFLVVLIDNTFARVRWQVTLMSSWAVAALLGLGNIFVLFYLLKLK